MRYSSIRSLKWVTSNHLVALALVHTEPSHKFDDKAGECYFVGYSAEKAAYRHVPDENTSFSTKEQLTHISNLVDNLAVEDIPTSSINKNHQVEIIIGPLTEEFSQKQALWNLVPLPKGKLPIGTRWVFKNKWHDTGVIIKNKAHLVVQGFNQQEGFDYEEGFAPVAKLESIHKALYGLHQAPRAWYATLTDHLLANVYTRGVIDQTLFFRKDKDDLILVQIYVEDIIFSSMSSVLCKEFEFVMKKKFEMSATGEMTFFLGLQLASTPMAARPTLTSVHNGEDVDQHIYRLMIGSLMYLTASRLDIMFSVCQYARNQVNPKASHVIAVKRIFCYLDGKPRLGLRYPKNSEFKLYNYSDSDFGGCNLDRKSTTGGCQYQRDRLVSWQWKKQTTISTSTAEAEYVTASSYCSKIILMQHQLLDYGLNFLDSPFYCDNEAALQIVKNPAQHFKSKHIDIRIHFIRDCFKRKLMHLEKVHTDDNLANLFTKQFDTARFHHLLSSLKLISFD
ncbi:hypothetical protein E3N88_12214 [Mikania micrantha]|uniref:Uncharacterized protein n=1 Tax=Mikania micrantha TaxID=192012 RepID=A0A5N6P7U7_9ASTR|nr:hypothetical protein E3N88_12214 [Mikania micrantha]